MRNPFSYGPRLNDASRFVNREKEIEALYGFSCNHICCSLIGERRIGKSSLLKQISLRSTFKPFGSSHGLILSHYVFVLLDLQRVAGKPAELFWRFLAQEVMRTLTNRRWKASTLKAIEDLQLDLLGAEFTFIMLEDLLNKIADEGFHLIILLDEFEYLTENPDFNYGFFGQLRSLADGQTLSYITASAESLLDLTYRSQSARESPFFNIFTPYTLGLFTKEAVQYLLREPIRHQFSPFNDEDIEFLIDLAGLHPYFLKWAGFILFEQYQSSPTSSASIRYQTLQKVFDDQTFDQFKFFWSKLNLQERRTLYEIAHKGDSSAFSAPIVRKLIARSLVFDEAEKMHVFSSSFGRFVRAQELGEGERDLREFPPEVIDKLKKLVIRFYQKKSYFPEEEAPPIRSKQVGTFEVVLRKLGLLQTEYIFIDFEQHNGSELTEFLHRVQISNKNSRFKFIYITLRSEINASIQPPELPHNLKIWFREQLLTEFESQVDLKAELLTLLRKVTGF